MIVCPVCEHAQPDGAECDVCGRRLAEARVGPAAAAPPPASREGFEPTRLPDAPGAGAFLEAAPELEPTRFAPVDAPDLAAVELEPTRAAPVDAAGEEVPDLEPTAQAGLPDDGPTPPPYAPTGRSCRTPAAEGERVCGRCGMRLPFVDGPLLVPLDGPAPEEGPRGCPSCGVPASGKLCPTCGARLEGSELM